MTITNVILDFDGTLTDVYAEAPGFETAWRKRFAQQTGLPEDSLIMLVDSLKPQIAADPTKGWERDGQIVVQAMADPFITTGVIYREIFDRLRLGRLQWAHKPLPSTPATIDNFFEEIFLEAYKKKDETIFRPGAKEFLDEVVNKYVTTIVTNSNEMSVKEKIAMLGDRFGDKGELIEVFGDAKKYINNPKKHTNNPEFNKVPTSMRIDGLDRDILLRREHYFETLSLLLGSRFYPHNTAIIGDIFELDLAMPSQMGYFTMQMETQGTQPHERRYHEHHLRSALVSSFDEAIQCLGQ